MSELYRLLEEILEAPGLTPDTRLDSLDTWDSLSMLGVMSMVHAKFRVTLKAEEFASLATIGDVERLVASRQTGS